MDYKKVIPGKHQVIRLKNRKGPKMLLQLLNNHEKTKTKQNKKKRHLTKLDDSVLQNSSCGWDALAIRPDSSTPALLHSSSNMFPRCGREQRGAEKPLMIVTGLELMLKPIDAE